MPKDLLASASRGLGLKAGTIMPRCFSHSSEQISHRQGGGGGFVVAPVRVQSVTLGKELQGGLLAPRQQAHQILAYILAD